MGSKSVKLDEGSRACEMCGEGSFGNQRGQTECNACVAGRFSSSQGTIKCVECPPGTYAEEPQQRNCTSCVPEEREDFHLWSTFAKPTGSDLFVISSSATSQLQCACKDGAILNDELMCEDCTCETCPQLAECELEAPVSAAFLVPSHAILFSTLVVSVVRR